MLQLQRPQPMPHAVPLHPTSHPSAIHPKLAYQQQQDTRQARPSLGSLVTPPAEMTSIHGAHNGLVQNGSRPAAQRPGDAAPLDRRHLHHPADVNALMANGARPPLPAPSQHTYGQGSRPSSPIKMAPSFDEYASSGRSSNNAVALSLQIPSTIKTPQASMPQLAAEVSLGAFSILRFFCLPVARLPVFSGSKIRQFCTKPWTRVLRRFQYLLSAKMLNRHPDSGNGWLRSSRPRK